MLVRPLISTYDGDSTALSAAGKFASRKWRRVSQRRRSRSSRLRRAFGHEIYLPKLYGCGGAGGGVVLENRRRASELR
jgi:hypothetical protein